MAVNRDKPSRWKADVALSVDLFNEWFLRFAPVAFRQVRVKAILQVKEATSLLALLMLAIMLVCVTGCKFVRRPTAAELRAIDQPSPADAAWIASVAPRALTWFNEQEARWILRGRSLDTKETVIAQRMGVQHPEQVRVVVTPEFPMPDDPTLRKEAQLMGLGSPQAGGFSMGYAVLIKPKYAHASWLLAHELVHVGQRERLGTEPFVRRYLLELHILGYSRSPLELEANARMLNAHGN